LIRYKLYHKALIRASLILDKSVNFLLQKWRWINLTSFAICFDWIPRLRSE